MSVDHRYFVTGTCGGRWLSGWAFGADVGAAATSFIAHERERAPAVGKSPPSGDDGKAAKAAAAARKEMKDNEEAAKAAMSRIPDSKEKYDPWRIAR